MSSLSSTTSQTTRPFPTSTAFPGPPQPPLDSDSDDEDDENHDGDTDHISESTSNFSSSTFTTSSATLSSSSSSATTTTLVLPTTSTYRGSTSTFTTSTSVVSSTPAASATTTLTESPARSTGQDFTSSNSASDSNPILNNVADPALEAEASSSPLGTAGIVLAAMFGLIGLVTTIYLFHRLIRRRKSYHQSGRRRPGLSRPDTARSEASVEKGDIAEWPPAIQETGIIFGDRSRSSSNTLQHEQMHTRVAGRGRSSFLNRKWYSTGTQFTKPAASTRTPSLPPTPPRWAAPFFNLGLSLRKSGTPTAQPSSTTALTDHNGTTTDTTNLERNLSIRSTGLGHARAYAHHDISAPCPPTRAMSTISSTSSRWLRRRTDISTRLPATNRDVSEWYSSSSSGSSGSPSPTSSLGTLTPSTVGRQSRESQSSVPRLPLPIALSGSRRSSGPWMVS